MKKKLLSISLIAMIGLTAISTPSCKKYEEGPGFTLMSKKARLAGKWKPYRYEYTDGTTETGEDDSEIEFKKDGTLILTSTDPSFSFSLSGTWEFSDNKEDLILKVNFFGDEDITESKIILLKNSEFGTEDEDGNKTYFKSID